jgi:hypothetical protein
MIKNFCFSFETKKKTQEYSYTCSRFFNLYFFKKKINECNFFFLHEGNKIFSSHIYKNIKSIEFFNKYNKKKFDFILKSKQFTKKNGINNGDYIELWQYSNKNKLKCKSRFYFPNEEIWDLKCSNSIKKKKKQL